ncbi:putative DNA binding domain-containing protein [Desulfohalobiaceae bacterium Ax17]|uniref:AlbA family DNA-binding domain-containing protein n=1 Tax=Desulfovulcanus ferrireducens TaxID=2831190 RepID=UPI00207BC03B|nr:RNA-binding domain-containing protein [Desulfovulcanus ferrireducens]MBT8763080.1 putative DNA binding domain-containing protein [Desulfovulcanus ferrireducens]
MREKDQKYLVSLVNELRALPKETEWVEFKVNMSDSHLIGEYISALANAAALAGKAFAYMIWGIRDKDHAIEGTSFNPYKTKVGNEELENWLLRLLEPKIDFRFFMVEVEGCNIVLLEIARAVRHPVRFKGQEFIRVGSYKKKLKDFPEKERNLWRIFDQTPFEYGIAMERISDDEVLRLLDYPAYFDLLYQPLPTNRDSILKALADDQLIVRCEAGGWNITNLGAILFAKHLQEFHSLQRKDVRVVLYSGTGRTKALKEQQGNKGYASSFESLISYINAFLPKNEVIEQALRKTVPIS